MYALLFCVHTFYAEVIHYISLYEVYISLCDFKASGFQTVGFYYFDAVNSKIRI